MLPGRTFAQQITIDVSSIDSVANCQDTPAVCQERVEELTLLVQLVLRQIVESQYPELPNGTRYYQQEAYLNDLEENPLAPGNERSFEVSFGIAPEIDRQSHAVYRETWRIFQQIVPLGYMDHLTEINFYNDKSDRYAALIYQRVERRDGEEQASWKLEVNLDNFSLSRANYNDGVETLTHETGHILLLNKDQMDYFEDEDDCNTHYVASLRACAREGSYYDSLRTYWDDDFREWSEAFAPDLESRNLSGEIREELESYYLEHEEEFVSEYAATSLDEDAAETIAHLARFPIPQDAQTLADKKIYALLEFDELVELRSRVQELLR